MERKNKNHSSTCLQLFFAVCICLRLFSIASASFEEVGVGARTVGLGGAFTAVADDALALYYNPAGMAHLNRKEISASYGLLQTGLGDQSKIFNSNIVYVHPFDRKIGIRGISNISVIGISNFNF